MANPRRRALGWAAVALIGVWTLAGAGHYFASRAQVTAETVAAYLHDTDPATLTVETRSNSLDRLAKQVASLPVEERRRARMDEGWARWFAAMSDAEKAAFIEATMPLGVRRMITSFEELPEEKRRRAVAEALRDLRRAREAEAGEATGLRIDTNQAPALSEELQRQLLKVGLNSFYSNSSPQTRAELAPVLEEMQRLMESGRFFRGERR